MTATNKPIAGESTKEAVKTIACGNAGLLRWTCGDDARVLHLNFAREAAGALGARHSPRPHGRRIMHNSGASRRGNADVCLTNTNAPNFRSSSPRKRGSSIPEAAEINREARGVLDRPVKPDDDRSWWRSEATKQSALPVAAPDDAAASQLLPAKPSQFLRRKRKAHFASQQNCRNNPC
jgi:hypothetical protein